MKLFFKTIYLKLLGLSLFSCQSKPDNSVANLRIQPNQIVHDTLSAEQIAKIKKIQATFAEVNPSTLAETLVNFQRDQNPDNEIQDWLMMAAVYENFLKTQPAMTIPKKQEVYKLVLFRSMMDPAEAKKQAALKILTTQEIDAILNAYDKAPNPLKVSNKPLRNGE